MACTTAYGAAELAQLAHLKAFAAHLEADVSNFSFETEEVTGKRGSDSTHPQDRASIAAEACQSESEDGKPASSDHDNVLGDTKDIVPTDAKGSRSPNSKCTRARTRATFSPQRVSALSKVLAERTERASGRASRTYVWRRRSLKSNMDVDENIDDIGTSNHIDDVNETKEDEETIPGTEEVACPSAVVSSDSDSGSNDASACSKEKPSTISSAMSKSRMSNKLKTSEQSTIRRSKRKSLDSPSELVAKARRRSRSCRSKSNEASDSNLHVESQFGKPTSLEASEQDMLASPSTKEDFVTLTRPVVRTYGTKRRTSGQRRSSTSNVSTSPVFEDSELSKPEGHTDVNSKTLNGSKRERKRPVKGGEKNDCDYEELNRLKSHFDEVDSTTILEGSAEKWVTVDTSEMSRIEATPEEKSSVVREKFPALAITFDKYAEEYKTYVDADGPTALGEMVDLDDYRPLKHFFTK